VRRQGKIQTHSSQPLTVSNHMQDFWVLLWHSSFERFFRLEVRKQGSLFYCHQITSPREMPLYLLIIIIMIIMWKNSEVKKVISE
jgi:hypothetical protein